MTEKNHKVIAALDRLLKFWSLLVLVLLLSSGASFSQSTVKISGIISDSTSGETLPLANVALDGKSGGGKYGRKGTIHNFGSQRKGGAERFVYRVQNATTKIQCPERYAIGGCSTSNVRKAERGCR